MGCSLHLHAILVKGPALKIRADARFQGLGGSRAYVQQKQTYDNFIEPK